MSDPDMREPADHLSMGAAAVGGPLESDPDETDVEETIDPDTDQPVD